MKWRIIIVMKILFLIIFVLLFVSCRPGYDLYLPSDPEKIRDFLNKYNIARKNCDGTINQEATVYAMVEFSRLNFSHTSLENKTRGMSILDLLKFSERKGYVPIDGCPGVADFYEKTLGAVGIEVVTDWIKIGADMHTRADFPGIGKTTLHGDEVHKHRFSLMNLVSDFQDIPSKEILAPIELTQDGKEGERRIFNEDLVIKYRPQFDIYARAKFGAYKVYYTEEEIKNYDAGAGGIDMRTFLGYMRPKTLMTLDSEIERLGGPEKAVSLLENLILYQSKNRNLIPVDPYKVFANECPSK